MDLYRYELLSASLMVLTITHIIAGRIVCRFEGELAESHSNMRALGDHLRYQQSSGYQPFFTVKDAIDDLDRMQGSGRSFPGAIMLTHE